VPGPSRCTRSSRDADKQKHTVEVRIGRDEDDRWWVVVFVDANDNEALWRGPYEDHEAAEKEGLGVRGCSRSAMASASGDTRLR
jgi:hypothetical protein